MSLHRTELYTMRPHVEGTMLCSTATWHTYLVPSLCVGKTDVLFKEEEEEKAVDFRQTFDQMVTSFGSERAKRALSAAKRNKIESTLLDSVMAPAVTQAEDKVKKEGGELIAVYFFSPGSHFFTLFFLCALL